MDKTMPIFCQSLLEMLPGFFRLVPLGQNYGPSARLFLRGVLVAAEAEERADIPSAFKFSVVGNRNDLDVVADGNRDQRVGNILQLARLFAADGAVAHHAGIKMAAVTALDRGGVEIPAQQQALHFAPLQRFQDMAQPNSSAPVALGLAKHLADEA